MPTARVLAFALLALPFGALAGLATPGRAETIDSGSRSATLASSDQRRSRRAVPRGTAGQQIPCTDNAARVVDDIYQQVLERPADQASAGLTQDLVSGRHTVRDIVAEVAKSPEHAERFFWRPVVITLYQQTLNRNPSEEELRDAASALASGGLRLPEMTARIARRASNNDEDAVRVLYRRLLGREADPDGLRGFTDLARREGLEAVARAIMASDEYKQRAGTASVPREDTAAYENAVRALYRHVLGRDPDPDGLRDLTQIAATSGFDAVVDRMITSSEYTQAFGSDVVPGRAVRFCAPSGS